MIVGCYSLDLYCRNHQVSGGRFGTTGGERYQHDNGPGYANFQSQTGARCRAQAKAAGWVFGQDREVTCPACSGKEPRLDARDKFAGASEVSVYDAVAKALEK